MVDDLVGRLRDDNSDYVYTERHEAADRIQALEAALAEAEGRVKAITIAMHDAIRRPMGQVPESADPFYSPAMAEQAEARRVTRAQGS